MAHRKFRDRDGNGWEIRPESRQRWRFEPRRGNEEMPRFVTPPGYTEDPFELSDKELQRMLDGGRPSQGIARKPSPFRDD